MGSGFSKMKKQARMMLQQLDQMKDQLRNTLVEGSAGNGLVKVTLNGEKQLQNISIRPECTSDLIVAAFERAARLESDPSGPGQASYLGSCEKFLFAPLRSGESPFSQEGVLQDAYAKLAAQQKTTDLSF